MIYSLEKYSPQIYTTGAYLRPLKMIDNNGKECWLWYVEKFEGSDSFCTREVYNPASVAKTLDDLLCDTSAD
jgi:hypothetical protein